MNSTVWPGSPIQGVWVWEHRAKPAPGSGYHSGSYSVRKQIRQHQLYWVTQKCSVSVVWLCHHTFTSCLPCVLVDLRALVKDHDVILKLWKMCVCARVCVYSLWVMKCVSMYLGKFSSYWVCSPLPPSNISSMQLSMCAQIQSMCVYLWFLGITARA